MYSIPSNSGQSMIMVVEDTRDLAAYEKTGKYEGVYHVLHGAISPMLGIGPPPRPPMPPVILDIAAPASSSIFRRASLAAAIIKSSSISISYGKTWRISGRRHAG